MKIAFEISKQNYYRREFAPNSKVSGDFRDWECRKKLKTRGQPTSEQYLFSSK